MLPAGAGVIPVVSVDIDFDESAPRRRGGDPALGQEQEVYWECSPQARG